MDLEDEIDKIENAKAGIFTIPEYYHRCQHFPGANVTLVITLF